MSLTHKVSRSPVQSFNQSSFKLFRTLFLSLVAGSLTNKVSRDDSERLSLGASHTKSVGANRDVVVQFGCCIILVNWPQRSDNIDKQSRRKMFAHLRGHGGSLLDKLFPTSRGTSRSVKDVQAVVNPKDQGFFLHYKWETSCSGK